jgi:hypothetical protein
MKRMLWLTMFLLLAGANPAWAVQKNGGLAASYTRPDGAFDAFADDGFGFSAIFDYPMARMIDITGSLGWYRFNGETLVEGTNLETDSTIFWEFVAGPQLDFQLLYVGIEGGYYTKFKEWGLVPNVGFRKDLIDISLRYKMTDDAKFYAVRLGFFF